MTVLFILNLFPALLNENVLRESKFSAVFFLYVLYKRAPTWPLIHTLNVSTNSGEYVDIFAVASLIDEKTEVIIAR